MNNNLGRQAANSAAWSLGGQAAQVIINILSMTILARLVSPDDFGIVAMVTALIGFAEIFREFGLSTAAIQAPAITRGESNNLFWVNSALGGILAAIFWALAEPIAVFYSQPELVEITRMVSLVFILNGISTQPIAMLTRDLKHRTLATITLIGAVVGLMAGVGMAFAGLGYWALVGMQIARTLANAVFSVFASKFVPALPDTSVSVRYFIGFGMHLLATKVMNYLSKNIDSVMIGRVLGAGPLGIYSRGYQLAYMPATQITSPMSKVAIPVLSRLADEPERFSTYLMRAQKALLLTVSLGYAFAIVFGDIVIRVGLGPGWEDAIPVFRILCVAGILEGAHNLTYWTFVSTGQSQATMRFSLITRPFLIIGIIIAVSYGIEAVAAVFGFWLIIAWPVGVYMSTKNIDISAKQIIVVAIRILGTACASAAIGFTMRYLLAESSPSVEIVTSGISMVGIIALLILIWPALRKDVSETLQMAKMVIPSR